MNTSAAQTGFTLVECVVALAILAMSLVAVYEALGGAIMDSGRALWRERAWTLAERELAIRASGGEQAREQSGREGESLHWTVTQEALDDELGDTSAWHPVRIVVHVTDPRRTERALTLETIVAARRSR